MKRVETMYYHYYDGFDYLRIYSELQASVLNLKRVTYDS